MTIPEAIATLDKLTADNTDPGNPRPGILTQDEITAIVLLSKVALMYAAGLDDTP